MSNEGVVENLRSQIAGLQEKLQQLEAEQETMMSSHRSSSEQHNSRLRSLERVSFWAPPLCFGLRDAVIIDWLICTGAG